MTRVTGPLLFALAVACSSKSGDKPEARPVSGFARTLEAVAAADPTQSAALLAQGAFETIAPSEMCLESFADAATERARVEALLDCGLACTLEAVQALKGSPPRTWMAALVAACDASHFGVEGWDNAMLSPEWFLVHKVGELAAPRVAAAGEADRAALEKAMAGFRLPLPLPAVAHRLYDLPVAPPEVSVPVATRTYVIMPAAGPLRVGATPQATLGPRGARMQAPDGQAGFPGVEAGSFDVPALLREAVGAEAAAAPAAAAPPGDQPAGLHGEVAKDIRGDAGGQGEPVPLLLADASRPAAEVIALASSLPAVLLAVAAAEDPSARALVLELRGMKKGSGPQAAIALAPGGLAAAKTAAGAGGETVLLRAEEGVPWSDAVEVIAVAVARGATRVVLTSARTAGGRTGWGASPYGQSTLGQARPPISAITEGAIAATGGELSSDVIRRVLRSKLPAFRACYERELERDGALAGPVDLEFTIGADGAVGKARGSGLATVSDCIARQVKAMRFPRPRGGVVEVRYPLVFKPKDPT